MANPFAVKPEGLPKPNRNTFDLSQQVNGTYDFGKIYPIYTREVIPGESLRLRMDVALKLLPMAFPTQTRMKAYIHAFYVRNRNLWNQWEDFITMQDDARPADKRKHVAPPYHFLSADKFKTGSLFDYLDVPTTFAGTTDIPFRLNAKCFVYGTKPSANTISEWSTDQEQSELQVTPVRLTQRQGHYVIYASSAIAGTDIVGYHLSTPISGLLLPEHLHFVCPHPENIPAGTHKVYFLLRHSPNTRLADASWNTSNGSRPILYEGQISTDDGVTKVTFADDQLRNSLQYYMELGHTCWLSYGSNEELDSETIFHSAFDLPPTSPNFVSLGVDLLIPSVTTSNVEDAADHDLCPFASYNNLPPALPLLAFRARAYDSVCNCYFRNEIIDPLEIAEEGKNPSIEFDKFCRQEGGKDSFDYNFHYRNWEKDFLTTCVPSPQMGNAPMVGFVSNGDSENIGTFTIHTPDDPDGVTHQVKVKKGDNGNATLEYYDESTPHDLKGILDAVKGGFYVTDFRNANALQRYLEVMIKNGYKYRDYLRSVHGVEPDYSVLAMPEYIGGSTLDVSVNMISNTAASETANLGEYAGQAFCLGNTDTISKYFDEHGVVIVTMCLMPVSNYSQLLPKAMLVPSSGLDYYNSAFANISQQPITYETCCPIERYRDSLIDPNAKLTDTFGYNRPWSDLVASYDTIHGDLRTTLQGYVINRLFSNSPKLDKEFIKYHQGTVNYPFVDTTELGHVAIGQIWCDVEAKLPLPYNPISKLE